QADAGVLGRRRVGHPIGLGTATVESLASVSGPHRALTSIQAPARVIDRLERHHGRGLAVDARAIPERVDDHLVLECLPRGEPKSEEVTPGELRCGVEERADDECVTVWIELVERT